MEMLEKNSLPLAILKLTIPRSFLQCVELKQWGAIVTLLVNISLNSWLNSKTVEDSGLVIVLRMCNNVVENSKRSVRYCNSEFSNNLYDIEFWELSSLCSCIHTCLMIYSFYLRQITWDRSCCSTTGSCCGHLVFKEIFGHQSSMSSFILDLLIGLTEYGNSIENCEKLWNGTFFNSWHVTNKFSLKF